ncbi:hypothetical protein Rhow_000663 [Rhodococcus wratislaviensis]|uniref:Uncharacterized protein n=1 Tax=Rhodococcus wratislaviensis TaxID=44752 RepID=A0A402C2L5_RHOWR|nr:hypothetical protein [Rhodococcus wratislaviensis]GCE37817.1 hypothetical protein Rhow_000663 [Rhodococcus wratislaviensis]
MITAVCAMVLGVLLGGSDLADRWRTRQSERARIAEIAAGLDRFQWWVLEDLADARQAFLYRDREQGDEEVRAFLAARERATKVGIPDELAVYRLADQMIRERDQERLG